MTYFQLVEGQVNFPYFLYFVQVSLSGLINSIIASQHIVKELNLSQFNINYKKGYWKYNIGIVVMINEPNNHVKCNLSKLKLENN